MSRIERVSCHVTRGIGVAVGLAGAGLIVGALRSGGAGLAIAALLMLALSLGLWLLQPAALWVAPGVMVLLAIVIPLGIINPFAAMERRGSFFDGHPGWAIGLGLGASALCLALGHLIGVARVAVGRRSRGAD